MAIPFVRLKYVKRSEGRSICQKSAYIGRSRIEFQGNKVLEPKIYDWSHRESPLYHAVLLPEHVDKKYLDPQILWNAVENYEKRKDAQVGIDVVLALPDDAVITPEQRINMAVSFAQKYFVSKGYGVQIAVHQPSTRTQYDEDDGKLSIIEKNNHVHMLVTPRYFFKDGLTFSPIKVNDLGPQILGENRAVFEVHHWEKIYTQFQNELFEELGLDLRVDRPGIISQIHLGAVRLRVKGVSNKLLEINQKRIEQNQEKSIDPKIILQKLTENKSVFTPDDLEKFLKNYLDIDKIYLTDTIKKSFWENPDIVELLDKNSHQPEKKYSTIQIIQEEKKVLRIADAIHQRPAFSTQDKQNPSEPYLSTLNPEQLIAFHKLTQAQAISCLEGLAGTGKSYLLFALKKHYEANGYIVRALGPDSSTVKVLEQKGFTDACSIHRFLYKHHYSKKSKKKLKSGRQLIKLGNGNNLIAPGKEVWLIDESSKIGNTVLLELLKVAEKNQIQLIFSGNSAQLNSVERGGMFNFFSDRYGHAYLQEVQRQHFPTHRQIVKHLASKHPQKIVQISSAVNLIHQSGGFIWVRNREEAVIAAVKKWNENQIDFPFKQTLIIAHTNSEVNLINDLIHRIRMTKGEVSKQEFECQGYCCKIRVSEGDLIEFRKNSHSIKVHNGEVGVLISASENEFIVQIEDRKVRFNPQKFCSFQLAYAVTYFRSQGRTVDRVVLIYNRHMNQKLMYVGESRHIRNVHCYVPHTEAACLMEIKQHLLREVFDKNTLSYTHAKDIEKMLKAKNRQESLEQLCQSTNFADKAKGYGFKAFDSLTGTIGSLLEKIQDRRPDSKFYVVPPNPEQNGFAKRIEIEAFLTPSPGNNMSPELKQIASPPSEDQSVKPPLLPTEKQRDQGAEYDAKTSQESTKKNTLSTPSPEALREISPHPKSQRSLAYQKLPQEKKELYKTYFQKAEEAQALYSIVKSESTSASKESAPSYREWQMACAWRNLAGFELLRKGSHHKAILGEKGFEILQDQALRYENNLRPKNSLEDALRDNIDHLLYKLFPQGPQRRDLKGYRFGNKGALAVTCVGEKKGCFYDFENKKGGSLIQLIEKKQGLSHMEAKAWAETFLNDIGGKPAPAHFSTSHFKAPKADFWISQNPPPNPTIPPLSKLSPYLDSNYFLTAAHPYHAPGGELVFYTLRLQNKKDRKEKIILPLSYGKTHPEGETRWGLRRPSNPPTIYNAHHLNQNPDKPVLIVEGEKATDAAQKLLGKDYVVISWLGGTSFAQNVNWEPLARKEVAIWPDNDAPGFKAASDIEKSLRHVGVKSLKIVQPDALKDLPEKWDLADPLPPGKPSNYIESTLLRADHKAINIERLDHIANQYGLTTKQLNEIVAPLDGQLRPELEKIHGSKTWEIETAILKEALKFIPEKNLQQTLSSSLSKAEGIDIGETVSDRPLKKQAEMEL